MFCKRRSTAFLQDIAKGGADFVEILKTVYPKASELHEKDFDWLFDCPELKHFLEWFCNTVREENLLSPSEVEAYENLLISGKPMLEKEALEQVLKTCHQSSQLRENETVSCETLEKEMQNLKSQCDCRIKQRNKLVIHATRMKQKSCHLEEKMEKASSQLKRAHLQLELDNFQSNDVFSQACKVAKELAQWHREPGNKQMKVLVAIMDLKHYMKLEEKFTEDLLEFLPKALKSIINYVDAEKAILAKKEWRGFQKEQSTEKIAKLVQKMPLENKDVTFRGDHNCSMEVLKGQGFFWEHMVSKDKPEGMKYPETEMLWSEALDIHYRSRRLKMQAPAIQGRNGKDGNLGGNLGSFQEELGRMELSYLCSQRLLVMTSAEIKGMSSALQWARKALKAAEENKIKEEENEQCSHIAACQEQRSALQNEVDQVTGQLLMPLLQGNARLLCLPVIHRKLDLEAIWLGQVASMQEEAAAQLTGQLSHLEVLRLLVLLEEKNLHQMNAEMLAIVNESEAKLQKLQPGLEASMFSVMQCPQTLIDPSDLTTLRVWKMLDTHGQEKQLFRTYETLAGWGSQLRQELKMLQMQLVTPLSQLPKLEFDHEILHSTMYSDSNQLMLCAQELSESLEQLDATQAKLYQMLMDTLSDLKVKHKSLQSHVQQAERNLYIHFFNNPTKLKKMVEELEEKANKVYF